MITWVPRALWKDKVEPAILLPGDTPGLVEVVKKTAMKHKGKSMDWLWGQVWEPRRFHGGGRACMSSRRLQVGFVVKQRKGKDL